jgi:hypothetical protein
MWILKPNTKNSISRVGKSRINVSYFLESSLEGSKFFL